jgi:hypothetical protein
MVGKRPLPTSRYNPTIRLGLYKALRSSIKKSSVCRLARFQDFAAEATKNTAFCNVTLCSMVVHYRRFEGTCCHLLVNMSAACSSETSKAASQTTRCHITDNNLYFSLEFPEGTEMKSSKSSFRSTDSIQDRT